MATSTASMYKKKMLMEDEDGIQEKILNYHYSAYEKQYDAIEKAK